MSRRARLEEEKLKLLNVELNAEEDKLKLQRERICAPLIWRRLNSGIKIQDLKPNYYDSVQDIIQEHYFPEELLCRNSDLANDPESVASFKQRVLFTLKDQISIIALDEANDDAIAGFLLMRVMNEETFDKVFSRENLVSGVAHKKCVDFRGHLNRKSNVFQAYHCDRYIQYYILCITPNYRKKGLGLKLLQCGIDVARTLDVGVLMGVFSTFKLQKLAKFIGMKVLFEVNYVQWRDKNKELIFDEPGVGNYTCAVMAGVVPPPPPPEVVPVAEYEEKGVKMGRDEKRKAKAKKGK